MATIDRVEGKQVVNELGIERLCVFGMPPVEFVTLAADFGCTAIGTALTPLRRYNPHGYPDWSLRDDPALRREMCAAMADRGVRISLLEGFGVACGLEPASFSGDLDLLCELGGDRINVASMDNDQSRTFDGFAQFAEMAGERGLQVSIEIGPGPVPDIESAMKAVGHVNRPNFSLLIDTMHFFRFGSTVSQLAAIDRKLIGYVQLCDAPRISSLKSYIDEAMHERMVPGEGELPLAELLALVPDETVVSVEIPRRSQAEAGVGPSERIAPCLNAARGLLSEVVACRHG